MTGSSVSDSIQGAVLFFIQADALSLLPAGRVKAVENCKKHWN